LNCDKCDKPATVHLTEIIGGQKIEKHLCESCAISEGITIKSDMPISQLLEDFILQTSGGAAESRELKCDVCGMDFAEFRSKQLLGCPHDYEAFEPALLPLLERAQDGASQHVGKAPRQSGERQQRQMAVLRLRAQLKDAVACEDYERAAELRDQIKQMEPS
jgi:protein arginine kinase activator